jgi:hypothetical protein
MRGFACKSCGAIFQHRPGADLHCGDECRQDYELAIEQAISALRQEGFSRETEAPNLFVKDGVFVSIEQVIHEGFENALAAHARAVAVHGGSGAEA